MTTPQEWPRVVSASRDIAAGAAEIFELIANPAQQPRWDGNDNLAAAPPGQRVRCAGDVFTMTTTRGNIRENHVVEFSEGRRLAWIAWYDAGWDGSAEGMWPAGPKLPVPLKQIPNGTGPPQFGDLIIFSESGGPGHVGIVVKVTGGRLYFVGENQYAAPAEAWIPINASNKASPGGDFSNTLQPVGWLRGPALGASSPPAVAVTGNGTAYVFWKGTDGNLWQAQGPATGALSGPYKLGMGPLGSAPAAGVNSSGATYVYWQGTDHNLWEAYWTGTKWAGPYDHGMGPLG